MEIQKKSASQLQNALAGFFGTFTYHPHRIGNLNINLTDGCDFLRQEAEAFWLFDAILSHQASTKVCREPFQVWKLNKQPDDNWLLSCEDGNKNIITEQSIEFSDFPLDEIIIWLVEGVAMLPTEY